MAAIFAPGLWVEIGEIVGADRSGATGVILPSQGVMAGRQFPADFA
jgi:hypothetical protein